MKSAAAGHLSLQSFGLERNKVWKIWKLTAISILFKELRKELTKVLYLSLT